MYSSPAIPLNPPGDAYSSTLPTVNAYPVHEAPTQVQVQTIPPPVAPSHVPPPPPQTYTPPSPSPIVDNSNTEFFVLLGRQPTIMKQCPKCKIQNIRTRVKTYPSVTSWLMTIGMIFVCFSYRYMPIWFMPVAFLPLVYEKVRIWSVIENKEFWSCHNLQNVSCFTPNMLLIAMK